MHKHTPIAAASILAIAGLAGIAYSADDTTNTGTTGAGTSNTGSYGTSTKSTSGSYGTSTAGTGTSGSWGTGTTGKEGSYGGGPSSTSTSMGTSMGTSTSGTMGTSGASGTSTGKPGGALGQGGGPQSCPSDDASKTQAVLSFLHDMNQNEIKEGKLAQGKAQSQAVKDFAGSVVKDHTDADQKLTDMAKKQSIDLSRGTPSDPIHAAVSAAADANDATLRGKTGKSFDFAFIGPQVSDHTLVMKVIDEGLKSAKDADTKKFLNDTRASIQMHQQHAARVQDQLASGTTTNPVGGGPGTSGTSGSKGTGAGGKDKEGTSGGSSGDSGGMMKGPGTSGTNQGTGGSSY